MTRPPVLILLFLLAPALEVGAQRPPAAHPPQETPPTFASEVELVTVDAVVVDKKGGPVTGLRKEDFLLSVDGLAQPVDSFEAVVLPPVTGKSPTPRHPPVTSNDRAEVRSGRVFAIVFDDMHLSPVQAHRAKQAVAAFLTEGTREGDRVILVASSGRAWWTARMLADRDELISILKRLDGRRILDTASRDTMTDYEALRIVEFHDTIVGQRVTRRFDDAGVLNDSMRQQSDKFDPSNSGRGYGVSHPMVEGRAQEVYDQALTRNRLTLQAIQRVLDGLGAAKGRKSLILVSEGFIQDPALRELRDVVRAAREANVAIYFVDTRGLVGTQALYGADLGTMPLAQDMGPLLADQSFEAQGAEEIASATGGFSVKNTNDLAGGITRISNELTAYYLLGYYPKQSVNDGRFHSIEVRVNRKNVVVRARRGYYAAEPGKPEEQPRDEKEPDPLLRRAVDAPFELDGVPLRMTAYALGETLIGQAKVVVAADIDIRNMAFEKQEDRLVDAVDLLLFVTQRESGEVVQYPEKLEMRLRPQTLERTRWYPLVREFDLGAGSYQAKLVVRDQNGGKVGSVLHSFTVPDLSQFRAATPVISNQVAPAPEAPDTLRPVVQVSRTFPAQGTLYCQIEVFNAQKDVESGQPRVTQGFSLRSAAGSVVLQAEPTLINATAKSVVTRLMGIPIGGLTPGEYVLEIHLKDELSGKTIELSEPLTLAPAS